MIKHTYRICGSPGVCGVSLYRHLGYLLVVVTELRSNPGASVAHCFEELATDIAVGLVESGAIEDATLIQWIQHYEPDRQRSDPANSELWERVSMDWDGRRFSCPRWKPLRSKLRLWLLLRNEIRPDPVFSPTDSRRSRLGA